MAKRYIAVLLLVIFVAPSWASVHNGRPKLVVVIVVDQFRGDYLERYRDQLGPDGFRLLMEKGAWFTECYYDYANLHTAPGHATLGTGAYSNGHGIINNDWYDPVRGGTFTSVQDGDVQDVGNGKTGASASPRNLLASTFGDEVKLATAGKAKVFGISLKDRSAILPVGHSADGAFWIDKESGAFISSTYYYRDGKLPAWAKKFNDEKRADKYLSLKFTDGKDTVFRTTERGQKNVDGTPLNFYDVVGRTPYANDYELEFARELITNEQLGQHNVTDVLTISISGYDILGHKVGPDSPQMLAETLALDKQLAAFFGFLGRQIGLANVWIALSADHGIPPLPETAAAMRIPANRFNVGTLRKQLNAGFAERYPKAKGKDFVKSVKWPQIFLDADAFEGAGVAEAEAERIAGELVTDIYNQALKAGGTKSLPPNMMRGFFTRAQLEGGIANAAVDDTARKHVHSYSPLPGWYVMMVSPPYLVTYSDERWRSDDDHGVLYSYDAHVPLILYGIPFQPGQYRTHAEPVDLAVTLTSLLGTSKPTHAVGRVLTEAIKGVSDSVRK